MAGWTFSHLGEKIWRVLYQLANVLSREMRPDSDCSTWIVQSWEPEMDVKSLCTAHEDIIAVVRNMRNAAVYVRLVKPCGLSYEDTY